MTQMRHSAIAAAVIFIGSSVLLFARLGHYALWDDEAITAMTARAVWQTGDTSARVDDHNLLVYRNGLLVRNFKDRYTSPLQFYVIAPFIGLLGDSNFVCRLPMALCGIVTVAILLLWLNRFAPPPLVWWSAAVILLTNASFFLFFRQCRYYGLATMLTAVVAYLYCNRGGELEMEDGRDMPSGPSTVLSPQSENVQLLWSASLALALSALLAAQYLDYAAVVSCLVVDYLLWGRKNPFTLRHWLIILLPQIIIGSVVLSIWNPLAQQSGNHYHSPSWITDRMYLLWWNWRDMIGCDFVILPLLAVCPLLYFKSRSVWMLRAPLALIVFVSMIALAVPTSLAQAHNAEVRYLAPALVLCIAVGITATAGLQHLKPKLKWTMLVIAAASVLIQPTPGGTSPVLGSSALLYYHELGVPQVESYTPVIDWINSNVSLGASIYVQPAYKTYPLMFRASKAIYAWQLDGDSVTFSPAGPSRIELEAHGFSPIVGMRMRLLVQTLTANDKAGNAIVSISNVNPIDSTPSSSAALLINAWNRNPKAAVIAIATGDSYASFNAVHRDEALHLVPSVKVVSLGEAPLDGAVPALTQTLHTPQRDDFRGLPDIHFEGRIAPDYMIRFGTNGESSDFASATDLLAARGIHYQLINTIHLNWKDLYRPERIWRSFATVPPQAGDEIYIYRKAETDSPSTKIK